MRAWLQEALASMRSALSDARLSSPKTCTLVVACALVVAAGPALLTLTRSEQLHASSSIAQSVDLPKLTQAEEVAGVQLVMGAILSGPDLQREVTRQLSWLGSRKEVGKRIRLTGRWREGRPEVVITARASDVRDARALAGAVARGLSERVELVARFGKLYKPTLQRGGRAFQPPTKVRSGKARPADRVLAALPGRLPSRPAPGWAAAAGLALAAALLLAVLTLGPWSRKHRRDAGA